ncbi:MAG: amidohydrolase family protein [Bacteroidota bacterium]
MKNFLILLFLLPLQLLAQTILIKDVNVIDVEKRSVLPNQSVLIEDSKIVCIAALKKFKKVVPDTVIEGQGKYLMPGMVDTHIHFFQSGGLYTRPDAIDLREYVSYADEIQFGKENAKDYLRRYLSSGITTVMDVGGPLWNYTVRDSIASSFNGPNVLVTGPLFSMVDRPQMDLGDPPIIKVSSKEDVLKLFNKQLPFKPDFIKVWYIVNDRLPAEQTFPLVQYLGELCREHNLKLAVHATQLETAKLAIKAGANILVHSVENTVVPDDFVQTLLDKKITYIPTTTVSEGYFKTFSGRINHRYEDLMLANPFAYNTLLDPNKIDSANWPLALKRFYGIDTAPLRANKDSIMAANLLKVTKAGVNVATGTDAGNIGTMHASSYFHELLTMQKAGLSNWDLIVSSTLNAARGFGLAEKQGSITAGKIADLVLLNGNPTTDIHELKNIEAVIKSGELLAADEILVETAAQVAQRQVNAYNARDIDAFLATYSKDVKIFNQAGQVDMEGHEAMRKVYGPMFEAIEDLYCEITNRIVINNKVIDKEKVRFRGRYVDAVAMYTVENGKITEVRFIK